MEPVHQVLVFLGNLGFGRRFNLQYYLKRIKSTNDTHTPHNSIIGILNKVDMYFN